MTNAELLAEARERLKSWSGQGSKDTALIAKLTYALERAERRADPPARSDKDYAIEHLGYLADAVDHYLVAAGQSNQDDRSDAFKGLRVALHDFRKRAHRAGLPTTADPPALPEGWVATTAALKALLDAVIPYALSRNIGHEGSALMEAISEGRHVLAASPIPEKEG